VKDFYKNGLNFSCQRCSNCCRHDSGYVYLSKNDLLRLTAFLNMPEAQVITTYCRTVTLGHEVRLSLKEKQNFDCIFWSTDIQGCTVYEGRPLQCSLYPFWEGMMNKEIWSKAKKSCGGLDKGTHHSAEEIETALQRRHTEPLINLKNR
jgi:Fe-S-cluster containining protein